MSSTRLPIQSAKMDMRSEKLEASQLRVLLVEDNPGDAELIKEFLSEETSVQLSHVTKLGLAVRMLERGSFDAVLLDLSLPDSQGLDSVESFRRVAPEIPLIVLTGLDDQEVGIQAIRLGAQEFLKKGSVDGKLIMRALHYAIERHHLSQSIQVGRLRDLYEFDSEELERLPNYKVLLAMMDQVTAQAHREQMHAAFLLINLDSFRAINEKMGMDFGNRLLEQVAVRLRKAFRYSDIVARLQGDQFGLVLTKCQHPMDASRAARKVLQQIAEPFMIGRRVIHLTASIGVSIYPEDGLTAKALVKNAEPALRRAKELGRNRYYFLSSNLNSESISADNLEKRLASALDRNEIFLSYPVLRTLDTRENWGYQAVAQWQHPTVGLIPASEFIPASEMRDVIYAMDLALTKKALEDAPVLWKKSQKPIGIHLSRRSFHNQRLMQQILEQVQTSKIPFDQFFFTVPWKSFFRPSTRSQLVTDQIKRLGIRLCFSQIDPEHFSFESFKTQSGAVFKLDRTLFDRVAGEPVLGEWLQLFQKEATDAGHIVVRD